MFLSKLKLAYEPGNTCPVGEFLEENEVTLQSRTFLQDAKGPWQQEGMPFDSISVGTSFSPPLKPCLSSIPFPDVLINISAPFL